MSKIKRWTVSLPNPDGYYIKPFDDTFHTPREIVLATDHDAEIERLRADRDSWADQAEARVKDCAGFIEEIERLKKRIRDLEQERRNLRVAINLMREEVPYAR